MTHDSRLPHPAPNPLGEQLSAWLDDELPAAEFELLAARVSRPDDQAAGLRAAAGRYALIGEVLRGGSYTAPVRAIRVADRVRAELEKIDSVADESPPVLEVGSAGARRRSGWLPFAAAAGVAAAGVLAIVTMGVAPEGPVTAARDANLSASIAAPAATVSLSPERLTNYLVYHGQYSNALSMKMNDSYIVNRRPQFVAASLTDNGR